MVVDGFARVQALNFGISGPAISEDFCPFNQQNKGFYWKFQALKSKSQGLIDLAIPYTTDPCPTFCRLNYW